MIRHHFGNVSNLKKHALDNHADEMLGVCDLNLLSQLYKAGNLSPSLKGFKRFVITSAVTGQKDIHEGFYKALKSYCRKNDACLLIVPCWDRAGSERIDKRIWRDMRHLDYVKVVIDAVKLNDKLTLNLCKVPPRRVDPTAGFSDLVHSHGSQIIASPKLIVKPISTEKGRMPQYLFTTGCLTKPDYHYTSPSQMTLALKSEESHFIAALVVEKRNDSVYHQRHLEANPDGSFTDVGVMYKPDGRTFDTPAGTITLGDLHYAHSDKKALNRTLAIAKKMGVDDLIIHDGMDGDSHNRHERNSHVSRAIKYQKGGLDIRHEIETYLTCLYKMSKKFRTVYDVFSNHSPEWLYKYLDEVDYRKDPINYEIANELVFSIFKGSTHILETYFQQMYPNVKNVVFLRMDQSLKYVDTQLGCHGHVGNKGARGTMKALKAVHTKSTSAHTHEYARDGNAMTAGHLGLPDPDYCKGGGGWTQTSILHYPDGSRQPVVLINGNWRL